MGKSKKAIVSVINDLSTDQRVERSCSLLHEMGFDILLVGRKLKHSPPLPDRPYSMHRMRLIWSKGPLFYIEYNLRLFFFLLTHKAGFLLSNDLDTLLPNFLVSKLKGAKLVYDSHEYFTGVPELEHRPLIRSIWKFIERWIFPRLKHTITVNESIALLFEKEYSRKPTVVRNVPRKLKTFEVSEDVKADLTTEKHIIILQGSGINIDRGAEEAVQAMAYLDNALLLIIGGGDVIPQLRSIVEKDQTLSERVRFYPRMPYSSLLEYTASADIGLSLDKGLNINYRFSLPNKLFDYIQCGTPVLASDLPEVSRIVKSYKVGSVVTDHQAESIASALQEMLNDSKSMEKWRENCKIASDILCWENEREVLREVYAAAIR